MQKRSVCDGEPVTGTSANKYDDVKRYKQFSYTGYCSMNSLLWLYNIKSKARVKQFKLHRSAFSNYIPRAKRGINGLDHEGTQVIVSLRPCPNVRHGEFQFIIQRDYRCNRSCITSVSAANASSQSSVLIPKCVTILN